MRVPISLLKGIGALITPQSKAILAAEAASFIIKTIKNKRKKSMKHARSDYDHIQDTTSRIPNDEPVFLLRGRDIAAPDTVDTWASLNESRGGDPQLSILAREQAEKMREWQRTIKCKHADR